MEKAHGPGLLANIREGNGCPEAPWLGRWWAGVRPQVCLASKPAFLCDLARGLEFSRTSVNGFEVSQLKWRCTGIKWLAQGHTAHLSGSTTTQSQDSKKLGGGLTNYVDTNQICHAKSTTKFKINHSKYILEGRSSEAKTCTVLVPQLQKCNQAGSRLWDKLIQ